MIKGIKISLEQIDSLRNMAKDSLPNESCAFLLGKIIDDQTIVHSLFIPTNSIVSPGHFSMSAQSIIDAYNTAEADGLEIVGVFHSHPIPSLPSSTDRIYMETNPVVWMIFSNTDMTLRSWILDETKEAVQVVTLITDEWGLDYV